MKENSPYSYFISPSANSELQKATKLHERRIIGIDGTFKDFIEWLYINLGTTKGINFADIESCKINKINIPISKTDFQVHKDELDLITEESIERPIIPDTKKFTEDFFKGKILDWSPYSHNFPFSAP